MTASTKLTFHLRRVLRPLLAAFAIGIFFGTPALGEWRQFRGNDLRSSAPQAMLPGEFNAEKNVAWKVDIPGKAASSPIVVDGRVITTSASGFRNDRLHVVAFDEATGKQLWARHFWATGRTICHPFSSVAANSPTSDGERIYAFFSSNDLACLDLDGNLIWYRGISHDYPTAANDVGMSASPCIVDGVVVVQVENEVNSLAMGLDKFTGKELWKVERPKAMNWTTPTAMLDPADGKSLVLLQSSKYLSAHEPRTGKEVWRFGEGCSTIASPLGIDGSVYVISGPGTRKLVRKGTTNEVEIAWEQPKLSASAASEVLSDGVIYAVNRSGVLVAASEADGKVQWQLRLKGPFWATPVLAGDKLYCFNHEGECQIVQLGAEGKIVGKSELGDKVLGSPAVSNGAMFVRSEKALWKIASE